MKIAILTTGTRGDVQPCLGLCLALKNRGHQVMLAAPPNHEKFVTSFDVEVISFVSSNYFSFFPLGSILRYLKQNLSKIQEFMKEYREGKGKVDMAAKMKQMWVSTNCESVQACQKFLPNIVLCHQAVHISLFLAEKLNIPCIEVLFAF
jgi:sterol 3beta-glucosyltransferase